MPIHNSDALSVLLAASSSQTQTRQRLKRSTMLAAALASGMLVPVMAQAQALPTGGQVVGGRRASPDRARP